MTDKELARLLLIGVLKSMRITDKMLKDYITDSFDEEKEGLPAGYFYNFMETQLNHAVASVYDTLKEHHNVKLEDIGEMIYQ